MLLTAILHQLEFWLADPWLLFSAMFVLAVANIFFPPLPLETVTLFAGYLSGTGRGSLAVIIAATSSGMFAGSMILYALARKYGKDAISKPPLKRVITRKSYEMAIRWFEKYGLAAIFLGKLIPGMNLCMVICCGVMGWPVSRVAPVFGASNLCCFGLLALLGRIFGRNWKRITAALYRINRATLILAGIFLLIIAAIKIRSRIRKRNQS